MIINNRMLFEFAPTGTVTPSHEVNAWPLWQVEFTMSGGDAFGVFITTFIVFCMMVYHLYLIIWHMYRCGFKFFGYAWNYMDCIIFLFWIIHLR